MPIQAPQWTDYLNCPACCREFGPMRSPVSLGCGHTLCRVCLKNIHRKQCPFDQTVISVELEELVVNTALLQLAGYSPPAQPIHPPCVKVLSEQDRNAYDAIVKCQEQLAVFLKSCGNANVSIMGSRLSRPMQRKLVTLLQCAMTDEEGRGKAARAARSLGERSVTELILQHQNPQQLSANLWAAVRARGCQFLGPAMQEEVLKLVLLALEDGSALSRKVLVMFVVQRLEPDFPQASKTSIGHVVQLLYRASCFKVSKRESDSSLMQLKDEFRTYECLRREHDAQIVQIATEAGLRLAPDQWSALLYGDTHHKSHMQSIIDKLQTPQSFAQSVQELFIALQRTGDPAQLIAMRIPLDRLANIDGSLDAKNPTWQQLSEIMQSLKEVVSGLVHYMQHQSASREANVNAKAPDRPPEPLIQQPPMQGVTPGRYKVAMCRDAQTRTFCPRGNTCTYAHSEEELERYRGMNATGCNGNYQYMMPALQPPVAVVRPIYQRFSVPPPPIHHMEGAYNMPPPPIQQQVSPSQRRSMIGADATEHDAMQVREPYEHAREPTYEHTREPYEHAREPIYEHTREPQLEHAREPQYEQPRELYENFEHARQSPYDAREFELPYEQRDQPFERAEHMYEHREPPYDDCEQTFEPVLDPNAATDNYVMSYVASPMQGRGSESAVGPIGSAPNTQNGNHGSHVLPQNHFYQRFVSEQAAYPYNGRVHSDELVPYPNMAGISGAMGQVEPREYAGEYMQPCYDENGLEMQYEGNLYGLGASRPLVIAQPQENVWPAPNPVKRPPMFKFNKTAKNLPFGMEIGQTIQFCLDINKNHAIGSSHINGYMVHHGMEVMRVKPKSDKRDDQEILEKELQALEKRISTEFCKSSDQTDSGPEE